MGCQKILLDEKICGQPIAEPSKPYCNLHRHKINKQKVGSVEIINDYIQNNEREYLDLSDVDFNGFTIKNIFPNNVPVRFQDSTFENIDFTQSVLFDVNFYKCEFENSRFKQCKFLGTGCNFEETRIICSDTIFENCNFILRGSKSTGQSYFKFNESNISCPTSPFSYCFLHTEFINFDNIKINSDIFNINISNDEAILSHRYSITFDSANLISIGALQFEGEIKIMHFPINREYKPKIYFSGTDYSIMKNVQFRNLNLENVNFIGSFIESIKFFDCNWPIKNGIKHISGDKFKKEKNIQTKKSILRLYTQLKNNYDKAGNYYDSGDWFYREMESRRNLQKSFFKRELFSFIALYKRFSNYGESYIKPLLGIIIVLLTYSWIYLMTGFTENSYINYDWFSVGEFSLTHIWNSFILSIKSMFFLLSKDEYSNNIDYDSLYISQLSFTVTLVPLFLLALRRKFRR